MHPQIAINFFAIFAAVAASFVFGALWFGPLFGKKWAALMNMPADFKPAPGFMLRALGLTVFGTFLTTYVLAHSVAVWHPSVWGVGADSAAYLYGFMAGFFTWIGFYVPLLLGQVMWEGKSWTLFAINAGHHFLNLQIIALILALWQ